MQLELWFAFVLACVIFSVSPGASMISIISNSITGGIQPALRSILGLQIGLMTHIMIVSVGLGALLATSALAFAILKYLGAAYLLYLGLVKIFGESSMLDKKHTNSDTSANKSLIWQGFVVNMMNPKSIVFLAAFFPQFLDTSEGLLGQYLVLGATVIFVDSLVMCSYAALANSIRPYLVKASISDALNKIFGVLFVGMGVLLARAER